jgi:hypothetical protein
MDTNTRRDAADERVAFGEPDRALSALIRLGWDAEAAKSSGIATYSRTTEHDQRTLRRSLLTPEEARRLVELVRVNTNDGEWLLVFAKLRRIAGDS